MTDEEIKLENERMAREFMRIREEGITFEQALCFTRWWREQLDTMAHDIANRALTQIRNQAFEEAAKEADRYADVSECAERAAAAIRALIHKPQNPPS